jgi:hypothetical protein
MALQTSNTFNNVQVDTRTFIDRAYGALRLRPQQITAEMVQIALDMINQVQQNMLNDSAPLWTLQKMLIPLVQGQRIYVLPNATSDVASAFYRNLFNQTTNATVTNSSAAIQFNFNVITPAGPYSVTQVSVIFPGGVSFPVVIQSSPDGINWTTVYTSTIYDNNSSPQMYELANNNAAQYWQVIPATVNPQNGQTITPPNTMTGCTASVYNTPQDVWMYRMNRDQYWNMTTKSFQGRPLQWWMNRQIVPEMHLWPEPDAISSANCLYVWRQRYIMDVGTLQQTIEFPARWYLSFFYRVASELGYCTPEADPDAAMRCEAKAQQEWRKAWMEERDKSPIQYQTNLRIYTR